MIFMLVALFTMGKGNFLSFIFVLLMILLFIFLFKKKDNKTKKIINESNYSNVMSKMVFYDDYFVFVIIRIYDSRKYITKFS